MRLAEAMRLANASGAAPRKIFLACGFTPLHLGTFLKAWGKLSRPDDEFEIVHGLFGDLCGNLERAAREAVDAAAVVVEWPDLDPRLGIRNAGAWSAAALSDIAGEAKRNLDRLRPRLEELARRCPVALAAATLPFPPISFVRAYQASAFELELRQAVAEFLVWAAREPSVKVVGTHHLDSVPGSERVEAERFDAVMELAAGFPYTLKHADALASVLWNLLYPPVTKKGLITDLDDTLWEGILGEVGADGVRWTENAALHGVYQRFLASLADTGVLVGVASKNDPELVRQALNRRDLLVAKDSIFPVEASWGAKSLAVGRILKAWNIAADSVVFLDDSPLELAEVKAAYPEMECILFPARDPNRLWDLLWTLRDLFGRTQIVEEDRLRTASLRNSEEIFAAPREVDPTEFLASLGGTVTIDYGIGADDRRTFDLINKTNQFNLNGRRFTESEWRERFQGPGHFAATVSYADKYGPLGKIAVVAGRCDGGKLAVDVWVQSCRAFSRRIEHHTLRSLFERFGAREMEFDYQATGRNGPLGEFMGELAGGEVGAGPVRIDRASFEGRCPGLPHRVEMV